MNIHLGSSSYLTDNFGRPTHYYDQLPFGESMVEHNQSQYYGNQYKFNGKELDAATGMYYYGARYYDPRLSIFISVDPLAEQTMEPYLYTGNNPIMFTDPTGMSKEGGEDFIYNKKEGTYHWDSNVSSPEDVCDDNIEYVGPNTEDVNKHHQKNNPFLSNFTTPNFGEDLNGRWQGEIKLRKFTLFDEWEQSGNILSQISYSIVNDLYISYQAFNPFVERENIRSIGGYGVNNNELNDAGISFVSSLSPNSIASKGAPQLLSTLNASQFSKYFKGTILTQTSHAKRGAYNRNLNKIIKKINKSVDDYRGFYKGKIEAVAPIIEKEQRQK